MTSWISVEDKLPELRTTVLCCVKNHAGRIIIALSREETTHDGFVQWIATFVFRPPKDLGDDIYPVVPDKLVTHWMELPELPLE